MTDADIVDEVRGTAVPVRGNDIDTDQIIPARFLKAVTFDGLGAHAFQDVRFDEEGSPTNHSFNNDRFAEASVLVVNANFGCGSSREHAPQALARWGIDAIVGESFAEIFAGNCLALGIPTVTASADAVETLQSHAENNPDAVVTVDVKRETIAYADREVSADVTDTHREALIGGRWDTTSLLRSNADEVEQTAADLPYTELSR